jgi:NAD+ kinase
MCNASGRDDQMLAMGKTAVKKIGLVIKSDPKARITARGFAEWLKQQGITVIDRDRPALDPTSAVTPQTHAPNDLFCVFVLGGDGTFLSAVRWIGDQKIPIIGVKFGELGFLAETGEEDLYPVAQQILAEKFTTTPRMRLSVQVIDAQDAIIAEETILNDVVINKGALARLANIKTYLNRRYLTTYRADGLIIATPTGSTAYSLAAGGPVVHPTVDCIILAPICPFTLTNRPLIVPDDIEIQLSLAEKTSHIMVTFDGQAGVALDDGARVKVRRSEFPVYTITLPDCDYFEVLKTKLRWSGGRA